MQEAMFHLQRGSTPCLRFSLPLAPDAQAAIYATFSQADAPVLEYRIGGSAGPVDAAGEMTLCDGGHLLKIAMTQADTLSLQAGPVWMQLRVRTAAGADVSLPCRGLVGEVQKEGQI